MRTLKEEALVQLVEAKLKDNCFTCDQTIDAIVSGCDITLVGWCDSEEQKKTAEMIVEGTYGVHKVIDNVQVRRLAQSL